jgi:hypothetical protein
MKKVALILFGIIGVIPLVFSQEYYNLNSSVSLFDKTSNISLYKAIGDNFKFSYSEDRQRFFIDFKISIKPNKYYRVEFKDIVCSGKEPPIIFIRFENKGKIINQTFFHLHARFNVFLTPQSFDRIRIILQYQNAELSFSTIEFTEYNENEDKKINKVDFHDLVNLLYDDDYTSYNRDIFIENVFDSLFICKWSLGNYYDDEFWIGNRHTRSQERWLYGYFWLQDLVSAYEQTGDIKYLEKAKEIINIVRNTTKNCYSKFTLKGNTVCFGNDSTPGAINKPMIWHDETVARRLFAYIYFYNYLDSISDSMFRTYMDGEIKKMALALASNDFYSQDNNHGMFQSLSLLAYSCYYNDSLDLVYQDIALSRLFDYFLFSFTDEGISREHTPTYHYTISNRFVSFIEFFQKYFLKTNSYNGVFEAMNSKFQKSKLFSYAILMPNNSFPPIGDCVRGSNPQRLYPRLFSSDTLNFQKNSNYYFESGYAIFRDKWNSSNSYYLLFLAAYNHWSHKHCDDLSFILYKNGLDIFIDCGYFGYEKNSDLVDYGNSSFAHNSLVVDNNNLASKENQDKKYSSVGISHFTASPKSQFVSGYNKRWENVEHYRSILHNGKETTVGDSIVSSDGKKHNYKLLYHLGSDIVPYFDGKKVTLKHKDKTIGKMFFDTESVNVHIYYGGNIENDRYIGYHCESDAIFEPIPHYVIALEYIGYSCKLNTRIILFD